MGAASFAMFLHVFGSAGGTSGEGAAQPGLNAWPPWAPLLAPDPREVRLLYR